MNQTHLSRRLSRPYVGLALAMIVVLTLLVLACGSLSGETADAPDMALQSRGSTADQELQEHEADTDAATGETAAEEEAAEAPLDEAAALEEPAAEAPAAPPPAPADDAAPGGSNGSGAMVLPTPAPSSPPPAALAPDAPELEESGMAESDATADGTDERADSDRASPQGAPAPLRAGEIDDNAQFEDYLGYLDNYGTGGVRPVDVSERYLITVLDGSQRPLLDVPVSIYNDQGEQVFVGRTYAGGQTLFLPRAAGVSPNTTRFRVVATSGTSTAEAEFERGILQPVEVILPGAELPLELRLDVLFLLDTTGSMADELARIQDTIDDIAQRIDAFSPRPDVRFALVAYRDEGDDYLTRNYDFTADVAAFREVLRGFDADGGGDTPEALEEALHQAVHDVQWADNAVRLVFLVADAAPNITRNLGYDYLSDTREAVARGIKIYPIAASNTDESAEYVFRQLAQQTMARFIFLTYQPGESSGAPGETTTLSAGEQAFTVERLDDLIVQVVQRELAAAVGME